MEILIAGGGIGGLAAAVALQQQGFDAHVFEAAPRLEAIGAGIWVPPNAMHVLARLGLADAVLAAGVALQRMEVRSLRGGVVQAIDGEAVAARLGLPPVAIRRSELQRILASALYVGSLHTARELTGFDGRGDGVLARFADGTEVAARLLVGADGIHSTVRRQLRPDVALRYSGQTCFRGLATLRLAPSFLASAWEMWGGAARFGYSGVGGDTAYWFAPITAPAGTQWEPATLKEQLLQWYAGFPAEAAAMIEATPAEAILQTDLYDFPPMRGWHAGSVVLLGDAAHAMTPNLGQGGAQALEDALSVALKLRESGITARALDLYERARSARTRKIVAVSWHLGRVAHWQNPLLQRVRDAVFRAIPARVQQRQTDELLTARV
jgi:2-polyprenyl-6-methoxyphenol hydroxylase-like FAD-dependent oxidoreductase